MSPAIRGFIVLLRPKHWIKNVVVLMPLLFSRAFLEQTAQIYSSLAFLFFSLAASSVYVVNDLVDAERDRLHPIKKFKRPIAANIISPMAAIVILVALYAAIAFSLFFFSVKFFFVVVGYILLNLSYSFYLKHQPIFDIFSVAAGFVLRVYAGALAIDVSLSSWMFITTLTLALYLASIKRLQELRLQGTEGRKVLEKYSLQLIERYAEFSAIGTVIFYSLYCLSEHPKLIFSIPLVLFGVFRYWYLVEKQSQGESPVDVLYTDPPLIAVVLLWAGYILYEFWP